MKFNRNRIWIGRPWALIAMAVILLSTCVGGWVATRPPRYFTYTTFNFGYSHYTALRFMYPADWESGAGNYQFPKVSLKLYPRPSTGLQDWLEHHGIRNLSSGWERSSVSIIVSPNARVLDLDSETRQIRATFMDVDASHAGAAHPQPVPTQPTQSIVHRSSCDLGRLLEVDYPVGEPGFAHRRTWIYASAQPGATPFKIEIRCRAPNALKNATYQIADHIIASLKLVKDSTDTDGRNDR